MSASRWEGEQSSREPTSEYQIIGNYAMGETIGKGSFGKVKKGRHLPTGENVAIKILNRKKLKVAKMDKKIYREIKILRLFSHANICRLYEVISTPTDIYLIMEYVEGGELFDYIVKKGMLKENAARYILQQIVCALEYCHQFRVVHRDLKPENILLGPGLQVKLIDFGLSNIMKDGEFLATSCGSPNYAAPEVISGKLYFGPEVDVWSCGVILFALLCGCLPFDEDNIPLLFTKIKKGRYVIPSHVSIGARELITRILVVDPLARLTIPQIRDNVWFNINLPARLSYNESLFVSQEDRISRVHASRAAKLLHLRDREVRSEIEKGGGHGFVAYNILFDADRRKQMIAEAQSLAVEDDALTSSRLGGRVAMATARELNLGLLLTQSPAMEILLDHGDATTNKQQYNGGNFVPASLHEQKGLAASFSAPLSSSAVFNISKRAGSAGDHAGGSGLLVGSLSRPSREINATGGMHSSASIGERQHVGSVAKSYQIFTAEEEEFRVQNNVGWRVGLMTDFNAATALSVMYNTLASFKMQWKMLSPFRILVRTTEETWEKMYPTAEIQNVDNEKEGKNEETKNASNSSNPQILLVAYLFRIHERHNKGYLVDFSIARGSFLALDIVLRLSTALLQRMGCENS